MIAGSQRIFTSARNLAPGKSGARIAVELIYIDAGGGHRSATAALQEILRERYPSWDVKPINLFDDVLRPLDPLRRVTGTYKTEDIYNRLLKHNWTYGFYASMRGLQKLIKLSAPVIERLLRQHWQKHPPDMVVSLIPHFNGVMFRALRQVHPDVPYVTIMTDIADCPPSMWQEKQDQFLIVGSDMAAAQARKAGYPASRVFHASGMIIKPGFYSFRPGEKADERRKHGLDPERPTAIVMFGGYGALMAEKIVTTLHAKLDVQSIVMCGRNAKLQKKLEKRRYCLPVGFTPNGVPHYMSLADFFIGKPGPGSLSEALHMGLPVIVERNGRTMPQERYNTEWIQEKEVGVVLKSFSGVVKGVRLLLENGQLETMRRNARAMKNRAVLEIPGMLEKIMAASAAKPRHRTRG